MGAGLLLLLAALVSAAAAALARAGLVTRPHAKQPLSDRRAAKLVHRSRFEPRPANRAPTHTMPTPAQLREFRAQSEMPYARYVTGHFTGTTDEVIHAATCGPRSARGSRGAGGTPPRAATSARSSGG